MTPLVAALLDQDGPSQRPWDQGVRGGSDVVAKKGEASSRFEGSRRACGSIPMVTVITTGGGSWLRDVSVGPSSTARFGTWSG